MKAKLTTVDPFSPTLSIQIDRWPIVIGGNENCDIVLADRWVDDRCCEIDISDGGLVVRRLGRDQQNGLLVNHTAVDNGALLPNDLLTIGVRTFRITYRRVRPKNSQRRSVPMRS